MSAEIPPQFQFDSGRMISMQAEDVPLEGLFLDFSKQVLSACDEHGLVIVGGESRLGKTEALLGDVRGRTFSSPLDCGGLVNELDKRGATYLTFELGAHFEEIEHLLQDEKRSADYLIIDESTMLLQEPNPYYKFDPTTIKELLVKGYKIILVGGGRRHPEKQCDDIKGGLEKTGLQINDDRTLWMPPRQLNDHQSMEILLRQYPRRITMAQAREKIRELRIHNIPTLFTIMISVRPDEAITDESYTLMRQHVAVISAGSTFLGETH